MSNRMGTVIRDRFGRGARQVEFRCRKCKWGCLAFPWHVPQLAEGQVPNCPNCFVRGELVPLKVTPYQSGPADLIV